MKRILLLEDDMLLGQTLSEMLEDEGYHVEWVQDGETAAKVTYERRFDLYVFDINVPLLSGFELLEALRDACDDTPTLFISAQIDLESISQGFRSGAFDYIKKPFYPEELIIRINAKIGQNVLLLSCGAMSYNPKTRTIYRNASAVSFGDVQHQLFELFIHHIGVVIPKDELLECLETPGDTALRVAVNKLRANTGWDVRNIRTQGYMLENCDNTTDS